MVDFLMERIGLESTAVGRGVEVDGGGTVVGGIRDCLKHSGMEHAGRAVFLQEVQDNVCAFLAFASFPRVQPGNY